MLQRLSFAVSFEDGACLIQEVHPKNLRKNPRNPSKNRNASRYEKIADKNKSIAEH